MMLKPLLQAPNQASSLFFSHRWPSSSHGRSSTKARPSSSVRQRRSSRCGRTYCAMEEARVAVGDPKKSPVTVRAVVRVKLPTGGTLSNLGLGDAFADLLGKSLLLELVSSELDPKTGLEKKTVQDYAHKISQDDDQAKYEGNFTLPANFGDIGAVLVTNEHRKEMFLKDIVLMTDDGYLTIANLGCTPSTITVRKGSSSPESPTCHPRPQMVFRGEERTNWRTCGEMEEGTARPSRGSTTTTNITISASRTRATT